MFTKKGNNKASSCSSIYFRTYLYIYHDLMPCSITNMTAALHLQCSCGAVRETATLLTSSTFPIASRFCHCNICRQTTGVLGASFAKLRSQPSCLSACSRYTHGGQVERYFCSTCGTRTFERIADETWYAHSGIIDARTPGQNTVQTTRHEYVADTVDGGLANPMHVLGGRETPCYAEGDGEIIFERDLQAMSRTSQQARGDVLNASCHCGTIQFEIRPPASGEKRPSVREWLGHDDTKYLGLFCFCRYCRLGSGQSLSVNTYVMPENIFVAGKSPFDYTSYDATAKVKSGALQAAFPGIRTYASAEDVRRSFCGTCGASVFWERESRPQCVNVAVGILRAESGSLAREWVQWDWKNIYWKENAVDGEMADSLEAWETF